METKLLYSILITGLLSTPLSAAESFIGPDSELADLLLQFDTDGDGSLNTKEIVTANEAEISPETLSADTGIPVADLEQLQQVVDAVNESGDHALLNSNVNANDAAVKQAEALFNMVTSGEPDLDALKAMVEGSVNMPTQAELENMAKELGL